MRAHQKMEYYAFNILNTELYYYKLTWKHILKILLNRKGLKQYHINSFFGEKNINICTHLYAERKKYYDPKCL